MTENKAENNAKPVLTVVGAGLAGCEAAWQAARTGVHVRLFEMKPAKRTPAHHTDGFAELVCSNSLRSNSLANAVGLLKEELNRLGSLVMEAAYATRLPAGTALAVDRQGFSDYITEKIKSCPDIEIVNEEVYNIDGDVYTVIATGPLTSAPLAAQTEKLLGGGLSFFDAAAPIVDAATVNMERAYFASRYGRGDADYINCPMEREEYDRFYTALIGAREAELHDFDTAAQKDLTVFEGCMPVEVMAKRGYDTLRYGPLKPVGLPDPKTGKEPYAVVQLRRDNTCGTMYNIVGFQTHLAIDEQKRVFRMIPGLENAEFLRFGVMHRNTYINSPGRLGANYSVLSQPKTYFAGQMTGVEGYIESAASGFAAGVDAARRLLGKEGFVFPRETAIGALAHYISGTACDNFQPMNINFGIIPPLEKRVRGGKAAKNEAISARSLEITDSIKGII